MISVVVAHSDSLVRAGVCSVLRNASQFEVVGETDSGLRLLELARRHEPNVVVTDVHLTGLDGVRATRVVRRDVPASRVLVHTTVASEEYVYGAFRAGAAGFLLHGATPGDLLDAVRAVATGGVVLSPAITRHVVERFLQFDRERIAAARNGIASLTAREHEVLAALARGLGNTEIAKKMAIGEGTVKAHVSHLLAKLDCTNRVQAALIARDSGLFVMAD
jgi:DNA-binding NarL/FixJ family response regulator